MSTASHSIDSQVHTHDARSADHVDADGTTTDSSSRTGLWLLLILLGAAFMGWYFYGKRAAQNAPTPMAPVLTLPRSEGVPGARDDLGKAQAAAAKAMAKGASDKTAAVAAKPRATDARALARNPQPQYPAAALRRGEGGTVLLRVNVGADGKAEQVAVARRSGSRELDRAAMVAVRDWRFKPATRNGREVASVVQQPVEFRPMQ